MGMIPLSEVSTLLGLSLSDTKILTRRSDFPSTELVLTETYTYWDKAAVEQWLLHLHCTHSELQRIAELTRTVDAERREHCYVTPSEFESEDDFWDSFTIEHPLDNLDNDLASEWLALNGG